MTATQIAALATQAAEFAGFVEDVRIEEWVTSPDEDAVPALASLVEAKSELDALFALCMTAAA